MNRSIFSGVWKLAMALLLAQSGTAGAADVRVFSTIGVRALLQELGPRFESATGHKLIFTFDVANALRRRIDSDEQFDVAILTVPVMDDLVKQNRIVAPSRVVIARGGMGLAVRAGAPKTDISSVEGFKNALLNAKSISYPKEGLAGIHVAKILDRLGITAAMAPKTTLTGAESPAASVARGEVEIAAHIIPELLATNGVELLGPLPPELQTYIILPGGVGANSREPQAAHELLRFLTGPTAVQLMKLKGYEPG